MGRDDGIEGDEEDHGPIRNEYDWGWKDATHVRGTRDGNVNGPVRIHGDRRAREGERKERRGAMGWTESVNVRFLLEGWDRTRRSYNGVDVPTIRIGTKKSYLRRERSSIHHLFPSGTEKGAHPPSPTTQGTRGTRMIAAATLDDNASCPTLPVAPPEEPLPELLHPKRRDSLVVVVVAKASSRRIVPGERRKIAPHPVDGASRGEPSRRMTPGWQE